MQRTLFILVLAAALARPAWSGEADSTNRPPPFLFAPGVRTVETSHDGYVMTFADGRKADVWRSGENYIIAYRSGKRAYATRLFSGWSVREPDGSISRWAENSYGYTGKSRVTSGSVGVTVKEDGATRQYISGLTHWRVLTTKK